MEEKENKIHKHQQGADIRPDTVIENRIAHKHAVTPHIEELLDEAEVAAIIKVDIKAVRYLTKRTKQLAYIIVGKRRLVMRRDLDDFLRRRRVRSVYEALPDGKEQSR